MVGFTHLPLDILYAVCAYIGPQDFLSLTQTCRELRALGSTNHAWRQLNVNIPLSVGKIEDQPVSVLRRSVVEALKIDANWKSGSSYVRNQTRFTHGDFIYFVHLLRNDWLFTLSRNGFTQRAHISAWNLKARGGPRRIAMVEPTYQGVSLLPARFSAAVHSNGESVVIAAFTDNRRNGYLQFFSLSLRPEDLRPTSLISPLQLEDSINVIAHPGLLAQIHDVQIYDHIIAASYTELSISHQPESYKLIILDIDNQHARYVDIESKEDMAGDKFVFKLLPDSIVIITSTDDDGMVSVYDLNQVLESSPPAAPSSPNATATIHDTNSLRSRYTSPFFSSSYWIYFTAEAVTSVPAELIVVAIDKDTSDSHLFRLPIPKQKPIKEPKSAPIEPDASFSLSSADNLLQNVCIGPKGRRMIWMEIIPGPEEIKLMKAILPVSGDTEIVVSELVPRAVRSLKPADCLSLWLDETAGRICFGLLDQQICILEI